MTRVSGSRATVVLDDGSERVVDVPQVILVEVGMRVTIIDVGDGKPIYQWGS